MLRRTISGLMLASLFVAAPAIAQPKIGVVNPAKILNEIKETKEANDSFRGEQEALKAQAAEKQKALQAITEQKNQLKTDAPQWQDLNKKEVELTTELTIWVKDKDAQLTRKFRDQAQKISEKIKGSISEVAKAKGLDLVLADQADLKDDEIDKVPPQNLMPVLLSKSIYYRNDAMDLTQEVIAKLDAGYKPAPK